MLFDTTRRLTAGSVVSVGVRPMSNSVGWVRPWLWQSCRLIWPANGAAALPRKASSGVGDFRTEIKPRAADAGAWVGVQRPNLLARFVEPATIEVWPVSSFKGGGQAVVRNEPVAPIGTTSPRVSHARGTNRDSWAAMLMVRLFQFQGWPVAFRTDRGDFFGVLAWAEFVPVTGGIKLEITLQHPGSSMFRDGRSWVGRPLDGNPYPELSTGDLIYEFDVLGADGAEFDFGYAQTVALAAGPPERSAPARGVQVEPFKIVNGIPIPPRYEVPRWANAPAWVFSNWFRGRDMASDSPGLTVGSGGWSGFRPSWFGGDQVSVPEGLTGNPAYWVSLMAATLEVESVGYSAAEGDVAAAPDSVSWWGRDFGGLFDGTFVGGTTIRGRLRGSAALWLRALPQFAMLLPVGQGWLRSWWTFDSAGTDRNGLMRVTARLVRPTSQAAALSVFDAWAPWTEFASLGGVVSDASWALNSAPARSSSVVGSIGDARILGGWGADGIWL